MTTFRIFSILPWLLISLAAPALQAQGEAAVFSDPLAKRSAFPVPPGAGPDQGYARMARYVIAFMVGSDERTQQVDAWYTEEGLEQVKAFYAQTFGHAFTCEAVDHAEFMVQHRALFKDSDFPGSDGRYEHCASGRLDLFSPVYNYALFAWQAGTMIVFRR